MKPLPIFLILCMGLPLLQVSAQQTRGGLSDMMRKAPALGDPLPDLTAYTADGQPVKLRDLKGHPTVLVFGCLT
ncbi:MAG: cytochrome oxidase Cu insertion factor (SCO1/SenC/PrrC family) [Kiritimatiellia bacterium]|jgi:cytochrome oxidase Cu insertion factor (SCO1/SenC/PrrC family)